MQTRKALDARAMGIMIVLCLIWSMQQIVLKATAADFSPVLQIALRSGAASLLVGLYMAVRGERIAFSKDIWKPGLLTGALFASEYLFVGEGLRLTSASHIVVFLYTAPIFAALGLHWKLPSERLAPLQWIGILLSLVGIAAAFLMRGANDQQNWIYVIGGDLLGLLGGMAWGATTVVIRTTGLASLPPAQTLLYQLTGAFALLLPAAILMGQTTFHSTPMVWIGFAFQSVLVSFASFLIWVWLLRYYLASRLGVLSFMTPLFGVLLGAWLLSETIEFSFIVGAGLVLAGVILVNGHDWFMQLWVVRNSPALSRQKAP